MRLDGEGVDEQGRFRNNCGIEERKRKIIKNICSELRMILQFCGLKSVPL